MSDIAVRVRGLGKTYRLGPGSARHPTLVDTVAAAAGRLRRPWRRTLQGETFWALRDASFEVREGEVLGIIGRNGAGKSTLLKILSRITPPTAGEAEVVGRLGSLLEVGTGFQGELSGRENIYLNGAIHGMRRAEVSRKLDDIVAFAEIERFLDTPVKHYSSGMYVRLAFAVAAHLDPDILVADEVLAVGDAAFQEKCLGRMREIAGRNRAVLFVTHSMPMVRRLCTRALLVDQGRVVRDGPVDEIVVEHPRRGRSERERGGPGGGASSRGHRRGLPA
jgi:lipopolysaccharide transport system ATP-binding protein